MSKSLFIDAFALMKIWAVGFFALQIGWLIHILPAIAVFALLLGLFGKKYFMHFGNLIKVKS